MTPLQVQAELRLRASAGLGSSSGAAVSLDAAPDLHRAKRWNQARQRYSQIEATQAAAQSDTGSLDSSPHLSQSGVSSHHEPFGSSVGDSIPDTTVRNEIGPQVFPSSKSNSSTPKISWVKGGTLKDDAGVPEDT